MSDICFTYPDKSSLSVLRLRTSSTIVRYPLSRAYNPIRRRSSCGRKVPSFTYFDGLFDRATGADPYRLAPLWEAARRKLSPATAFDVSFNNDVVGGNSGSPLVDRNGDTVGVVFDGNIHSLGGFYLFDPVRNRSIAVTSVAIEEALAKVYGLHGLVAELKR